MSTEDEGFLKRWSRLKGESRREAPVPAPVTPAPPAAAPEAPLPSPETLDFSSDFSPFLAARVEETVKRAALGKLFHSDHFNVMDGLDVYIDDYGRPDPIPPEMLARLNQARDLLFGDRDAVDDPAQTNAAPGLQDAAAEEQAGAPASVDAPEHGGV